MASIFCSTDCTGVAAPRASSRPPIDSDVGVEPTVNPSSSSIHRPLRSLLSVDRPSTTSSNLIRLAATLRRWAVGLFAFFSFRFSASGCNDSPSDRRRERSGRNVRRTFDGTGFLFDFFFLLADGRRLLDFLEAGPSIGGALISLSLSLSLCFFFGKTNAGRQMRLRYDRVLVFFLSLSLSSLFAATGRSLDVHFSS